MPGAVPCEARWGTSLLSLSCEHRGTHNWKGPTSISQSVRRLRTDLPERTHQVAAAHRRVGGGAGAGRGGGGGAVQVRGRSHADPPRPRPRSSRGAKVSEAGGGGSFGVRCLREISPFFRSQEVLPPPPPRPGSTPARTKGGGSASSDPGDGCGAACVSARLRSRGRGREEPGCGSEVWGSGS